MKQKGRLLTFARNVFGAMPALAVKLVRSKILFLSSETTSAALRSNLPNDLWASR